MCWEHRAVNGIVTDNEGAYCLVANSFEEFYQNWLDRISDTEKLKEELDKQRKRRLRKD